MTEIRWFNKNKSCIEMSVKKLSELAHPRLIRTRVVLKSIKKDTHKECLFV